jgi:hypothetical protein
MGDGDTLEEGVRCQAGDGDGGRKVSEGATGPLTTIRRPMDGQLLGRGKYVERGGQDLTGQRELGERRGWCWICSVRPAARRVGRVEVTILDWLVAPYPYDNQQP